MSGVLITGGTVLDETGERGADVRIADGRCAVAKGLEGKPDCVVSTTTPILAGIESGAINPQLAFLLGRIRVSDLDSLLRLVKALRRGEG